MKKTTIELSQSQSLDAVEAMFNTHLRATASESLSFLIRNKNHGFCKIDAKVRFHYNKQSRNFTIVSGDENSIRVEFHKRHFVMGDVVLKATVRDPRVCEKFVAIASSLTLISLDDF